MPKSTGEYGEEPIHWIALEGKKLNELTDEIDPGCDINARDGRKWRTALHWACKSKNEAFIEYLLEIGAETDLPDIDGRLAKELLPIPSDANQLFHLREKDDRELKILEDQGKVRIVHRAFVDCPLNLSYDLDDSSDDDEADYDMFAKFIEFRRAGKLHELRKDAKIDLSITEISDAFFLRAIGVSLLQSSSVTERYRVMKRSFLNGSSIESTNYLRDMLNAAMRETLIEIFSAAVGISQQSEDLITSAKKQLLKEKFYPLAREVLRAETGKYSKSYQLLCDGMINYVKKKLSDIPFDDSPGAAFTFEALGTETIEKWLLPVGWRFDASLLELGAIELNDGRTLNPLQGKLSYSDCEALINIEEYFGNLTISQRSIIEATYTMKKDINLNQPPDEWRKRVAKLLFSNSVSESSIVADNRILSHDALLSSNFSSAYQRFMNEFDRFLSPRSKVHGYVLARSRSIKKIFSEKLDLHRRALTFNLIRPTLPLFFGFVTKSRTSFLAALRLSNRDMSRQIRENDRLNQKNFKVGKKLARQWSHIQFDSKILEIVSISSGRKTDDGGKDFSRSDQVLNFQSYSSIVSEINEHCKVQNLSINEPDIAYWVEEVAKHQTWNGFWHRTEDGNLQKLELEYDHIQSLKDLLAKLTYLLFGAESARNPTSFILHGMLLKLIQEKKITWEQALSDPANQGKLGGGCAPMSLTGEVVASARTIQKLCSNHLPKHYSYEGPTSKKAVAELVRRESALLRMWHEKINGNKDGGNPFPSLCKFVADWYPDQCEYKATNGSHTLTFK